MHVHVVTAANRHLYPDELDQFFRERHRVFVEEKHWRDDDGSGREIDQFDTDEATYLIGIENDRVMTGTRLIPTDRPNLTGDVFRELHFGAPVRDPRVADWTRGFISPEYRERGIGPIKGAFCSAVMDYCLEEGITWIGGLQDAVWQRLWRQFGWRTEAYGPPVRIEGRLCVVAYMEVSHAARDGAARNAGTTSSLLVRRGPERPFFRRTLLRGDGHAA